MRDFLVQLIDEFFGPDQWPVTLWLVVLVTIGVWSGT